MFQSLLKTLGEERKKEETVLRRAKPFLPVSAVHKGDWPLPEPGPCSGKTFEGFGVRAYTA